MTATVHPLEPVRKLRRGVDAEFWRGAIAMIPMVVGLLPLGLAVGAAVGRNPEPLASLAGTWLIYGASAHLAVMELIDRGTGLVAVVLTGLLLNVRLVIYGSAIAPLWRDQPLWRQALAAAMLVDPAWAVAQRREDEPGDARARRTFYIGAAATLWVAWGAIVTAGANLGPLLGSTAALQAAVPVGLAALVAPRLADAPTVAAVAVATVVVVVTTALPSGTDIILAAVAGGAFGAALYRGDGGDGDES